jgi:hypothetical protein
LIHLNEFEKIFSSELIKKYFEYLNLDESNQVNTEIYFSFIYRMNESERDFRKRLHDIFIKNIDDINTALKKTDVKPSLNIIFEKMLKEVVDSIITNETSLYQYFDFKNDTLNALML